MTPMTDMQMVVDALSGGDRFLVTSHENPDGDALGSLLAMHLALRAVGKDDQHHVEDGDPIIERAGDAGVARDREQRVGVLGHGRER